MQQISITPRSVDPQVTLTDAAVVKVAELIESEGNPSLMLRVGVKPGGCSGFSYEMFFDSETNDDDIVNEFGGVSVAVDSSGRTCATSITSSRVTAPVPLTATLRADITGVK